MAIALLTAPLRAWSVACIVASHKSFRKSDHAARARRADEPDDENLPPPSTFVLTGPPLTEPLN